MQGKLSRAAQMLLGFTALVGVVKSAAAAGNTISLGGNSVWTVYAFGNAQAVADAFRALTNFANSGTFQSIVSMVATLGVLGVGASGGFNPSQARKLIGYFVGVFLTCYFLFGVGNGGPLVVNLEVIDTVDMTWKAPVTVPAVVGIPASIVSSAGYAITKAVEASFSIPEELKMSNGAPFNLAASMIADASQARITDPNLASSLAYYVQDCFTIGVARGALAADTLIHSTDFLNDIHFNNQSVMVNTMLQPPVGTAGVVTCDAAWTLINNAITAQGVGAADFLKDASAWTKTPAMSVINAAADRTAEWASNNGVTDGGAMVKQSAILSAFRGAYSQSAIQTGNSEFLTGLALSQATESQRSSWITGAEVFNKSMGYIFAILQVFVYAITPLILCAALVPGLGLALFKNFAQILLWLAIWQPMLAIVNFIVLSMQQSELGGILSNGAGYGFTLSNLGIVSEKSANLRAAATFVGTMVPALAWAMVKGSMDFSRVIGSAVGENFAQGAANTMTTGNYSLNQASMDSFTANKHSTASAGAWGNGHSTADSSGTTEHNNAGDIMATAGGERLGLNTSASMSTNQGTTGGSNSATQENGSNAFGGGHATSMARGGGHSTGGGQSEASSVGTGLQAGANLGAGFQMMNPGAKKSDSPGGSVGGGAGGGAGGSGDSGGNTSAQLQGIGSRLADRTSANLGLSAGAGINANKNKGNNFAETDNATANASVSDTSSSSVNGSSGASKSTTAGEQHGAQTGEAQNLTGISSAYSRAQVMTSYMRMDNNMTQGEWARSTPKSSNLGDKVEKLGEHGAVAADVKAENDLNHKNERKYGRKAEAIQGQAHGLHDKNAKTAEDFYGKEVVKANAAEAPAQVAPSTRLGNATAETWTALSDGAKHLRDTAVEGVKQATPQGVKDAASAAGDFLMNNQGAGGATGNSNMPTARDAAHGATGPHQSGPQTPSAAPHGQPAAGKPAGNQEHTVPSQTADGSKAVAGHHPGGTEAPKGGNEKPQQVASQAGNPHAAGAPKTDERGQQGTGAHKPDERNQVAQADKQRERELEDRQNRQLAATAAVGQVLQASQSPQQPGAAPAPAAQPLAAPDPTQASQLAASTQQQPGGNAAATPNPFSGEKSSESAGQMQGQVQMAEQRAERMGNQLKGVDGMLASADGRKPGELPDLINQARDLVRNA